MVCPNPGETVGLQLYPRLELISLNLAHPALRLLQLGQDTEQILYVMTELSDLTEQLEARGGVGAAVFGDYFETGRDIEKSHVDDIQTVFDRYLVPSGVDHEG